MDLILRKRRHRFIREISEKIIETNTVQGLPAKTPNVATRSLLGIPPIESVIHKSVLNLFMNILREKESVEYKAAERQLQCYIQFRTCNPVPNSRVFYKIS